MKTLFVYDSGVEQDCRKTPGFAAQDEVVLFPLTSGSAVNSAILSFCRAKGAAVSVIDSAAAVNESSDRLRGPYLKFISDLPGAPGRSERDLKRMFALDERATLWWFSLIAEKNTVKSDAFLRLAQLDAIAKSVRCHGIERIIYSSGSGKLRRALSEYAAAKKIRFALLKNRSVSGLKGMVRSSGAFLRLKHIFALTGAVSDVFRQTAKVKRTLAGLRRRSAPGRLAIVTYYPNIDLAMAARGAFKNKFWPELQDALENEGREPSWIIIYVPAGGSSLKEHLDYVRAFIQNGRIIYFLDEFNSLFLMARSLCGILASGVKFISCEGAVRRKHTFGDYNFYEIFRDDWVSSFAGPTGYRGMLYYGMFLAMLKKIKPAQCLYPCEMHAWEKALNAAKAAPGREVKTYAYQPTTISRMLLNYFNHPDELSRGGSYAMPRPDRLICNGDLSRRYFLESGWTENELAIGEAIRYSYLKEHVSNSYEKKPVILVLLSISPEESCAILTMAEGALKNVSGAQVWIKPHPFLDLEAVLESSGLSGEAGHFKIRKEPLEKLLPDARIVIAGESGAAIEALAFGCEIITVSPSGWVDMSPLRYEKSDIVRRAASAEELKRIVEDMMSGKGRLEAVRTESLRILNGFFCLDLGSSRPSRILEILK